MKAIVCVLLVAAVAVFGAEEKKTEKRGLFGLGYGLGHGYYGGHGLGLYSGHGYYGGHGLGLYEHSIAAPVVSHAIAPAPIITHGHGFYGGHGLHGGHGLYGGHGVALGAPLLGLGHGWH